MAHCLSRRALVLECVARLCGKSVCEFYVRPLLALFMCNALSSVLKSEAFYSPLGRTWNACCGRCNEIYAPINKRNK